MLINHDILKSRKPSSKAPFEFEFFGSLKRHDKVLINYDLSDYVTVQIFDQVIKELEAGVDAFKDEVRTDVSDFKTFVNGELDKQNQDISQFKKETIEENQKFKKETEEENQRFQIDIESQLSQFKTEIRQDNKDFRRDVNETVTRMTDAVGLLNKHVNEIKKRIDDNDSLIQQLDKKFQDQIDDIKEKIDHIDFGDLVDEINAKLIDILVNTDEKIESIESVLNNHIITINDKIESIIGVIADFKEETEVKFTAIIAEIDELNEKIDKSDVGALKIRVDGHDAEIKQIEEKIKNIEPFDPEETHIIYGGTSTKVR